MQEKAIKPLINELKKQYIEAVQLEQQEPGRIKKSKSIIEQQADKDLETFKRWATGADELERMEKGFQILMDNIDELPNKQAVLEDIRKAGERLYPKMENATGDPPYFYDTLLEMFGLSEETYFAFYTIGARFFNEKKFDEALDVFTLLTNLTHLVFEPWLGLGVCWQKSKNDIDALRCFSMASLVDFNNPAPHLYSAGIYLKAGKERVARETFDLAKSLITDDLKGTYKKHIRYLEKEFNKGRK